MAAGNADEILFEMELAALPKHTGTSLQLWSKYRCRQFICMPMERTHLGGLGWRETKCTNVNIAFFSLSILLFSGWFRSKHFCCVLKQPTQLHMHINPCLKRGRSSFACQCAQHWCPSHHCCDRKRFFFINLCSQASDSDDYAKLILMKWLGVSEKVQYFSFPIWHFSTP